MSTPCSATVLPESACRLLCDNIFATLSAAAAADASRRVRVAVDDGGVFFGDLAKSEYVTVSLSLLIHWLEGQSISALQGAYLSQTCVWNAESRAPELPEIRALFGGVNGLIPAAVNELAQRGVGGSASLSLVEISLWASGGGPTGVRTLTSWHYDGVHGVLQVVKGKKCVRVAPPDRARALQAYALSSPTPNHARAPHGVDLPGIISFELTAGHALFIPEGWWHTVDSEPETIAVSFWFSGARSSAELESGVAGLPYLARSALWACARKRVEQSHDERAKAALADLEALDFFSAFGKDAAAFGRALHCALDAKRGALILTAVSRDAAVSQGAIADALSREGGDLAVARSFSALDPLALDALASTWGKNDGCDGLPALDWQKLWVLVFGSGEDAKAALVAAAEAAWAQGLSDALSSDIGLL
jgi:hypothetical protein